MDGWKGNIYCTEHRLHHEWGKILERDQQTAMKDIRNVNCLRIQPHGVSVS
jgi:hypothetical protein